MAKYNHRIFEMYEFRDEALRALTPRTNRAVSDAAVSESWTFTHLAVSNAASVTHVEFKGAQSFGKENLKKTSLKFTSGKIKSKIRSS